MSKYESDIAYLESWSEELTARANRVRQLIGDRHWLTDGHHKEVIVREFLVRYLPSFLEIGSGFIKSRDGSCCSPEIDILISDWSKHPAYFNEGGIQIIPPSSAVAYIEMKSNFSSSSLSNAIQGISNSQLSLDGADIWRCICFASVEPDHTSFADTLCNVIRRFIDDLGIDTTSKVIQRLPTCISSFESYVVFIRENQDNNSIVLKFFDFGKLSSPIIFSDLFEYVRCHFGHTGTGELSDLVMDLPNNEYFKRELPITL